MTLTTNLPPMNEYQGNIPEEAVHFSFPNTGEQLQEEELQAIAERIDHPDQIEGSGENNDKKIAAAASSLAEFGLPYNPDISLDNNRTIYKVLSRLRESGALEFVNGKLILDPKKFSDSSFDLVTLGRNKFVPKNQVLELIHDIPVITKESSSENSPVPQVQPLVQFPKSLNDIPKLGTNSIAGLIKLSDCYPSFEQGTPHGKKLFTLPDNSRVELRALLAAEKLQQQFGVPYDTSQNEEFNYRRMQLLNAMEKLQLLKVVDKNLVLDLEAIHSTARIRNTSYITNLAKSKSLPYLENLPAYSTTDYTEQGELKKGAEKKPIILFPHSIEDLAEKSGYPERSKQALVAPWEFGPNTDWLAQYTLRSGETVNAVELFVATMLRRHSKRIGGSLFLHDPATRKEVPFNPHNLYKITGHDPSYRDKNRNLRIVFSNNGYIFAKEALPRLLEEGILKLSDFTRTGGSSTAEMFGDVEREIKPESGMVMLRGEAGSAKYYLGKSAIVEDMPKSERLKLGSGRIFAKPIARNLAGIFQEVEGEKKILRFTLDLLNKEELQKKEDKIRQRLEQQIKDGKREKIEKADITGNVFVGAKEVKERIHRYEPSRFLPQREKESTTEYGNRMAKLGDTGYIIETVQPFFTDAGVNIHKLPWAEQLMLANAFLEGVNREQLKGFARTFKLNGVRTFASLDYDSKLGNKIF